VSFAESHRLEDERVIKGQQVADQLAENEKSQRLIGQIEMPETFGQVPWHGEKRSNEIQSK
jgi:hypothetical protein